MSKKKSFSKGKMRGREQMPVFPFVLAACLMLVIGIGASYIIPAEKADGDVPVVISEVMTANRATWPNEDGVFCDWVELYNSSEDTSCNLTGWHVSGNLDSRGAQDCGAGIIEPGGYRVVYLDGGNKDSALSSNGASIYLTDARGNIRSALEVPALAKGESYALSGDGVYSTVETPTPGAENTRSAWENMLKAEELDCGIYINEVMASGQKTLPDRDGEITDYIELCNATDSAADLSGWYLTDDISDRHAFELPRMVLEPGECLLIRASGKESAAGEICTPFKLRAKADDVYLINPQNRIVSHVNWTNLKEDEALSRLDDGSYSRALPPSPGYGNEEGNGSALYGSDTVPLSQNDKALYINEIICSSSVGDWIEIYNDSSAAADLGGWWLSDNPKHIHKWEFPAGSTVPAKGYLCVLLIPEGTTSEYSPACDEFRLSKLGGETVSLTPPEGEVLDSVELQAQRSGVSYGRSQETGTYRYFTTPTPNEKNKGDNYAGITADVEISHAGGWIGESSITVSMTVPRNATVYYTTDGSEPDRNSKTYSQPIVIKEDTVVKAIAAKKDCLPSYSVARTYLFGEPSTLRTVCVSGSASELTSSSSGVLRTGGRYPRAVYLEVYDYDGTPMVMQGCELMTQGRSSRVNEHYKQKAFKLIAKNSYGNAGTFKSALFTKRDLDEYNSFMMRASGQDCFDAHMKDSVLTSLLENTKVCYQETELAALYVNGEYWGMYNMRERNDPDTVARKNGWLEDKDDIEIIRGDGGSASQGKPDFYNEMMDYVRQTDLSSDEGVEGLKSYCDIESYLDYVIFMMYSAQEDLGNTKMYRNPNADGLFRWIAFDMDLAYCLDSDTVSRWLSSKGTVGTITPISNELFYKLMHNASVRDYFLTRFGELLAGPMSSENICSKIEERAELISNEMKKNCARWEWKYSAWQKNVKRLYQYADERTERLIKYAISSFKLSDEQAQQYFGAAMENEQRRHAGDVQSAE